MWRGSGGGSGGVLSIIWVITQKLAQKKIKSGPKRIGGVYALRDTLYAMTNTRTIAKHSPHEVEIIPKLICLHLQPSPADKMASARKSAQ